MAIFCAVVLPANVLKLRSTPFCRAKKTLPYCIVSPRRNVFSASDYEEV